MTESREQHLGTLALTAGEVEKIRDLAESTGRVSLFDPSGTLDELANAVLAILNAKDPTS
jgi:hypothetical protein